MVKKERLNYDQILQSIIKKYFRYIALNQYFNLNIAIIIVIIIIISIITVCTIITIIIIEYF